MSAITAPSVSQEFLKELARTSPKASFTPFDKIGNALKYLETHGLPTSKNEEYKYCNIESLIRCEFKKLDGNFLPPEKNSKQKKNNSADEIRLVFWNGELSERLSDQHFPEGIIISSINKAAEEYPEIFNTHFGKYANESKDPLIAMNTAFTGKGLFIYIKRNVFINSVIRVTHVCSAEGNVAQHTRNLIVLGENAQVKLVHEFRSENSTGKYLHNHLNEISVNRGANLELLTLQHTDSNYFGLHTLQCHQEANSVLKLNTITLNGNFVRNNVNTAVTGEHAETHLNGLTIAGSTQLVDHHTLVDHAAPQCVSNELYKGIATDKSTLIFNGKIYVKPHSQKINAYQSSKNILLSDEATINTKPQLEIFANDVKCSHGTSTGKVDDSALFYLKSRGIGEHSAKKLLLHAFASEILSQVEIKNIRTELEKLIEGAIETIC